MVCPINSVLLTFTNSSEGKIYATNIINESGEIINAPLWGNNELNIIFSLVAIPGSEMTCSN